MWWFLRLEKTLGRVTAWRVEGREGKRPASLAIGSQVIASLNHDAQVSALKMPALQAALAFKGVDVPHGIKKHALVELLRSKLMLPNNGAAPRLPDVDGCCRCSGS